MNKIENPGTLDSKPADRDSKTSKLVLHYGYDKVGTCIPLRTLKITNNTKGIIYPILQDPNSKTLADDDTTGLYDPYDDPHKEYRAYIGYYVGEEFGKEGTEYFFGLKAGDSILMRLPLVFWNGGRICIGTDDRYLVSNGLPMNYDTNSLRTTAPALGGPGTIKNGIVMWYKAGTPQTLNDDTAVQLAEWTIRSHKYLSNEKITNDTDWQIPDSELVDLINYDVSNVDNLFLPLAMEVTDGWVMPNSAGQGKHANRDGYVPGSNPDAYGWTGAIISAECMQEKIRAFTAKKKDETDKTLLGNYFGGNGWPFYYIPNPDNDPDMPIKIPSGANIFAQSPIKDTPSSYVDGS